MEKNSENIISIPIAKLRSFPNHPFRVSDDEEMQRLAENIRHAGVLTPILVRRTGKDTWQIISGHRRAHASKLCGKTEIPAVVLELDDDEAVVTMVDSNFQRERILPSEKAKAYKMKYDAMKHQGRRSVSTSDQRDQKSSGKTSRDILAETSPDSSVTIARYLRLNELIPELMQQLDQGVVAMTPAVELSFLPPKEQRIVADLIESEQISPSRSQANQLHTYHKDGMLTDKLIRKILLIEKKPDRWRLALTINQVSKYFPTSYYSPQQMEETIIKLLDTWQKQEGNKHTKEKGE